MVIETERLRLVQLSAEQQLAWANGDDCVEKELGCTYRAEIVDAEFADILRTVCEKHGGCGEKWLWHGFFWLIEKESGYVVGSADYKNEPDGEGKVEIGYGLGEDFRGRGYMSEAVDAMCEYVLNIDGVTAVVADTEKWNSASERVLERCGFEIYNEDKELKYWKREKESEPQAMQRRFWQRYLRSAGLSPDEKPCDVFCFDITRQSASHLLSLVMSGKKTATSSAYPSYIAEDEPLPKVGDRSIVTDFDGVPYCVIETTAVTLIPFGKMTFDVCRRECEDECLETWVEKHTAFFAEDSKEVGYVFDGDMPVVFENFRLVYKEREYVPDGTEN